MDLGRSESGSWGVSKKSSGKPMVGPRVPLNFSGVPFSSNVMFFPGLLGTPNFLNVPFSPDNLIFSNFRVHPNFSYDPFFSNIMFFGSPFEDKP